MKTPTLAFLNSLGFRNRFDRVYYAAIVLRALAFTNPKTIVQPAYAANPLNFPPTPATPEIAAPASTATPNNVWTDAITIDRDATARKINIVAKLPVPSNGAAVGFPPNFEQVREITASTLIVNNWIDTKPSNNPTLQQALEPTTLEKFFAKWVNTALAEKPLAGSIKLGNHKGLSCLIFTIALDVTEDYDFASYSFQLDKIVGESISVEG